MENPKCIRCYKELEVDKRSPDWVAIKDGDITIGPLYGGVICKVEGNYGSTVHDPLFALPGGNLYFALCDRCFKARKKMFVQPKNNETDFEKGKEALLEEMYTILNILGPVACDCEGQQVEVEEALTRIKKMLKGKYGL